MEETLKSLLGSSVRIGNQMENILLAMLKAEKDPSSQIGQVMAKNADAYGAPGLGTMDLMRFLKGKLAFDAEGKYRQPARRSYWRSLKTLVRYGLIRVVLKKSQGRHGYLYQLTPEGRMKAEVTWAKVSMFINEYSKLV
ncbi:MAG: hypothetical protein ACFFCW_45630 [Candidatus Hodarchaeota archaeon]